MEGLSRLSDNVTNDTQLAEALKQRYNADVSPETGQLLKVLANADDPEALVYTASKNRFNKVEVQRSIADSLGLHREVCDFEMLLDLANRNLEDALVDRSSPAKKASQSRNRDDVYIPSLVQKVGEEGTV
jgi:hypothetical protein